MSGSTVNDATAYSAAMAVAGVPETRAWRRDVAMGWWRRMAGKRAAATNKDDDGDDGDDADDVAVVVDDGDEDVMLLLLLLSLKMAPPRIVFTR